MSSKTTNYKLHKIDLTDAPPDITVLNGNFDIIDTQLKGARDAANNAISKFLGDNRNLVVGAGDRSFVNFNMDTSVPYVPTVSNYTYFITINTTDYYVESALALPLDSTNRVYYYSRGRGEWDHLVNAEYVSQFMGVASASLE